MPAKTGPCKVKVDRPIHLNITLSEGEYRDLVRFAQTNGLHLNQSVRYLIGVAAQTIPDEGQDDGGKRAA